MSFIPGYQYFFNTQTVDSNSILHDNTLKISPITQELGVNLIGDANITDLSATKLFGTLSLSTGSFDTLTVNNLSITSTGSLIVNDLTLRNLTSTGSIIGNTGSFSNLRITNAFTGATGTFNSLSSTTGTFTSLSTSNFSTTDLTLRNLTSTGSFTGATGTFTNLLITNAFTGATGTFSNLRITNAFTGATGTFTNLRLLGATTGTTGSFNFIYGSGVNLTALNATQLTSGTVPSARITGAYTSGITNLTTTGINSFAVGSVSAPSLTFTSNTTTGIYRGGTGSINFTCTGVNTFTCNTGGIFIPHTGSVGLPSITLGGNKTGLYQPSTNTIAFSITGTQQFLISATGVSATTGTFSTLSTTTFISTDFATRNLTSTGAFLANTGSFTGTLTLPVSAFTSPALNFANGTSNTTGISCTTGTTGSMSIAHYGYEYLKLNGENSIIQAHKHISGNNGFTRGTSSLNTFCDDKFYQDTGINFGPTGGTQLNLSVGGTNRISVSSSGCSSVVPYIAPVGSVGAPSYTFTGDLDTGLYRPFSDALHSVCGGNTVLALNSNSLASTFKHSFAGSSSSSAPSIFWGVDYTTGIYPQGVNGRETRMCCSGTDVIAFTPTGTNSFLPIDTTSLEIGGNRTISLSFPQLSFVGQNLGLGYTAQPYYGDTTNLFYRWVLSRPFAYSHLTVSADADAPSVNRTYYFQIMSLDRALVLSSGNLSTANMGNNTAFNVNLTVVNEGDAYEQVELQMKVSAVQGTAAEGVVSIHGYCV